MPSSTNGRVREGIRCNYCVLCLVGIAFILCLLLVGCTVWYFVPCWGDYEISSTGGDFFLPKNIKPEHYDLLIQPYFKNFTFEGRVKILLKTLERTDKITLHGKNISVDNVTLTSVPNETIPVTNILKYSTKDFLIFHLGERLKKNHNYSLEINFTGVINDGLEGFYWSSYINKHGKRTWLAATKFEPTHARKAFPCFDEPDKKATFSITIVRLESMKSLSNMPLDGSVPLDDEWMEDHYQKSVPMSTYLVSYVVSNLVSFGSSENFEIWGRSSAVETASYALEITPKLMSFFEKYFDFKYSLPKMNFVAIPDYGASGMENWGIVAYRESRLLLDNRFASLSDKTNIASLISHELVHQWFGNLVTMGWWNDIWLNEGFATYLAEVGVGSVHPEWQTENSKLIEKLHDIFDKDLDDKRQVSQPAYNPDAIDQMFGPMVYSKASSIIRMIRHHLGDETFQKGLQNFLKRHQYSNAMKDDLYVSLVEVGVGKSESISSFTELMDSWIEHPGYPLVTLTRNYKSNKGTLRQERFHGIPWTTDENHQIWCIPITYTVGDNPDWETTTKFVMRVSESLIQSLPSSDYWVLLNVQQVGYYRVNYDKHNWDLLIRQLLDNHNLIHEINRAQILNDAGHLVAANLMEYDQAHNLSLYLQNETDYLPWKTAVGFFKNIADFLGDFDAKEKWKDLAQSQFVRLFDSLGWNEIESESIQTKMLRSVVLSWLCKHDYEPCVKEAVDLFNKWRDSDTNNSDTGPIVPPNFRDFVYCTGVRKGGAEAWSLVWERYLQERNLLLKRTFLNALMCTRDSSQLKKYLILLINNNNYDIRLHDSVEIFQSILRSTRGRQQALTFVWRNQDKIISKFGTVRRFMRRVFLTVCNSVRTTTEVKKLSKFKRSMRRIFHVSIIEECEKSIRTPQTKGAKN